MSVQVRDHVPVIAAVLSVVSLGLVFAAAGGVIPASSLPRAPESAVDAIPHVNAAISLLAVAVIGHGWRAVRRGDVTAHRRAMGSGFGLFALFLALYLYKVALRGPAPFPEAAPEAIYQFVYLPVLAVHILLAVVCVPLLYYVLLLALTRPVEEIPLTNHPRIGRVTATLWLVSFGLGLVVYALLYLVPF
jgi:putative membrane protein